VLGAVPVFPINPTAHGMCAPVLRLAKGIVNVLRVAPMQSSGRICSGSADQTDQRPLINGLQAVSGKPTAVFGETAVD